MKEEVKRVPVLRFPEFEEDWEIHKLGDLIASMESGISVNSEDYPAPDNGVYGVLKTSCISSGSFTPKENKQVVPDDISRVKLNPTRDSIIVSRMNTPQLVGESGYVYDDFPNLFLPDRLWLIKTQKDVNAKWLSLVLISSKVKVALTNIATGTSGSMKNIAQPNFLKITTLKPSLPEQQKIASFLTAVDDKIQQLNKKKALLEQYKKGVMQQLFSQTLRFKDDEGNEYPDWEEKMLGEIGDFQTSSIDKLSKENEKEVYLVNYMNVYRHENINSGTVKSFQIVTAKDAQIASCNLKKGDILFTPSSETPEDIGHSVVIFEDLVNAVFSYHLMRFRPIVKIDILYSHYFCNIPNVLKQLSKLATGSTRFTISVKSFSSIKVNLPCLEEQTKIANFLSAIDEKITGVDQQIEYTKQFKKGLLQQMFV